MASLWDQANQALSGWQKVQQARKRKETGEAVCAVNGALLKVFGCEAVFAEDGSLIAHPEVFAFVGFSGPMLVKRCEKGHTVRLAALTITGDISREEVQARIGNLFAQEDECDICAANRRPSEDIKKVVNSLRDAVGAQDAVNLDWQARVAIETLEKVLKEMGERGCA